MSTEKVLKVRLQEKIDTLDNWLALDTDANPFIPLKGEKINVKTENQILCKTGDGHMRFKELPYDVYSWAKTTTKPTYTASEVGADAAGAASVVQTNLNTHSSNTIAHTTQTEKDAWNKKIDPPLILDGTESDAFAEATAAYNAGRQIIYIPHDRPSSILQLYSKSSDVFRFIGLYEPFLVLTANLLLLYNNLSSTGWEFNECQIEDHFKENYDNIIDIAPMAFTEYAFTDVTQLTMRGDEEWMRGIHGFVVFASSAPVINISGFAGSSGDDITQAKASEVWEFSIDADFFTFYSYIIWKNWGVPPT